MILNGEFIENLGGKGREVRASVTKQVRGKEKETKGKKEKKFR